MDQKLRSELDIYSSFDVAHVKSFVSPEYSSDIELGEYSRKLLDRMGIVLYRHQAQAVSAFRSGNNVAVVTPTASGKTLSYVVAYLEELYRDENAVALYIAPINALINDQARKIEKYMQICAPFVEVYSLTAATSNSIRGKIKSRGRFILTNPEMLVYSLILYNKNWERFWRNLRIIVVDEIHEMSGIRGSHFGNLMRVVNLMNDLYGNNARYFALSGTIGNPKEFIENIFGKRFVVIDRNTAGNRRVEFLLPTRQYMSIFGPTARIVNTLKSFIFGLSKKTLVFVKSRKMVEMIAKAIKNSSLAKVVSPYRSGYEHRDRIAIENMFKSGKLMGLVATSAFEMGIDIEDLDVVCVVGFPSSRISLRQRFGRTGRVRDGIIVFFPTENILDRYYYNNPKELFSDEVESLSANVYNDRIIGYYVALSVVAYNDVLETGKNFIFSEVVEKYWGVEGIYSLERFVRNNRGTKPGVVLEGLTYDGKRCFFTHLTKNDLRKMINLRGIGKNFDIYDVQENRKIGEIAIEYVFSECHPGGIYVHMGDSYRVENVDFDKNLITVVRVEDDVSTEPIFDKDVNVLGILKTKNYEGFSINYCKLKVKEMYKGFLKLKYESKVVNGEVVRERKVVGYTEYPTPYVLEYDTEGIVLLFDGCELRKILNYSEDVRYLYRNTSVDKVKLTEENVLSSGLHAAEHAIIGMYPTEVVCSRSELGGFSFVSGGSQPTIVVYEAIEGGAGYSEIAFSKFENIVRRTSSAIVGCICSEDSGCPACIQSPKCGNGNTLLSKRMGQKVLEFLIERFGKPVESKETLSPRLVRYSIEYLKKDMPQIEEGGKYACYNLLEYPLENFRKPLVFDLETQKYSYEVGGWKNARDMLLAVAVVYDVKSDKMLVFNESNVKALVELLFSSDIVIGYNVKNFDYKVLSRYDSRFEVPDNVKTFDILNDLIKKYVGDVRISLDNLVRMNINGKGKETQSSIIPQMFREGKIDVVIRHCEEDVRFTYEIMEKILKERYLRYMIGGGVFEIEFPEVIFRFKL